MEAWCLTLFHAFLFCGHRGQREAGRSVCGLSPVTMKARLGWRRQSPLVHIFLGKLWAPRVG